MGSCWIIFSVSFSPLRGPLFNKHFQSGKCSRGLGEDSGRFWTLYPRVPPCIANFLNVRPRITFLYTNLIEIENYGEKHLRINSKSSGAHFPTDLMIFKTAISFKVFIVGISVFSKTCWKLNFTAI